MKLQYFDKYIHTALIIILVISNIYFKFNPSVLILALLAYQLTNKYLDQKKISQDLIDKISNTEITVIERLNNMESKVSHLSTKDTMKELTRKL